MAHKDLDREFSETAARQARERQTRPRQARQKQAQTRRVTSQREYIGAEPIAAPDDLSAAIQQLANSWGLKKKTR